MTEEETKVVQPKGDDTKSGLHTGKLDPKRAVQIAVVGRKRSGKSELAWLLFNSYPFDRVLIDPNGDLLAGDDFVDIEPPVGTRWPSIQWPDGEENPRRRESLRFVPNLLTPTHDEDMDRAAGLAYGHAKRTMLFVDEAQHAAPVGAKTRAPHMYRCLAQSRHGCGGQGLSMILAMPRPMAVTPLAISQADLTYIFKLPNPGDRKRVADCIGFTPRALDEAVAGLGPHEFLCFDVTTDELTHYPALPKHLVAGHAGA